MSELIEIDEIRKLIRDVVFDKGNKTSIIGNGCFCAENIVNSAYNQGRADERAKFMWCLEHFDYHMSREELIQKVKEFLGDD